MDVSKLIISLDELKKYHEEMNNHIQSLITSIQGLLDTHTSDNNIHTSSEEKENLSKAYSHSTSSHAPTDAEKNIIVGVQKNGKDLNIDGTTRKIDIIVPTKVSELENDKGFIENGLVEVISDTEPTGQNLNSYWIQEYLVL